MPEKVKKPERIDPRFSMRPPQFIKGFNHCCDKQREYEAYLNKNIDLVDWQMAESIVYFAEQCTKNGISRSAVKRVIGHLRNETKWINIFSFGPGLTEGTKKASGTKESRRVE